MATNSKKSKSMTALVIAIIVVIAAIGFVVYDEWSSHSSLFGSEKFATAVAKTLNVTPASLSEESLSDVKLLEVYFDATNEELSVTTAGKDFDAKAFLDLNKQLTDLDAKYTELTNDTENDHTEELNTITIEANALMTQLNEFYAQASSYVISADEAPVLDDVKYFGSVEILNLASVSLTDSSVFAGMKNLLNLSVQECGLTEVNGLTGLNAEAVYDIAVSESGVTDWSPLNYIAEKVTIPNYIDFGNGQVFQYGTTTLADYNKSLEEAETSEETVEGEVTEETVEEATEETVEDEVAETEEAVVEETEETAETVAE